MRFLVDLVDSLTGTVRFIIVAIMLSGFLFTIMTIGGISYLAPKVADNYGERAERIGDRAIAAAQEEVRNRELAKEGWGYGEPASHEERSRDSSGEIVGGWGEN